MSDLPKRAELGRLLLAVSLIGLAAIGFLYADFVRQWQPVPHALPFRPALPAASNLILLACGIALAVPRLARLGALAISGFLILWVLTLHLPAIASHPSAFPSWGYLAGVWTVSLGGLLLWALLQPAASSHAALRVRTFAPRLIAPALMIFGTSHLLYAPYMTQLVPSPVPFKLAVLYLTGLAHIAAGLALLFNLVPGLAATLEATMMTSFILLVDLANSLATGARPPLTALCFEAAMAGSIWIVAGSYERREKPAAAEPVPV